MRCKSITYIAEFVGIVLLLCIQAPFICVEGLVMNSILCVQGMLLRWRPSALGQKYDQGRQGQG